MRYIVICILLLQCCLAADEKTSIEFTPSIEKNRVLYLMQSNQCTESIDLYFKYYEQNEKHDYDALEQIGLILLSQGITSSDEEKQLLSIYGAGIAGVTSALDIYELGIKSQNPMTQMATIQLASQFQDDRVDDILYKAFSSDYLTIRLEAAYHLAMRKSYRATSLIDSLMQKLPKEFHPFFPEIFALLGTQDAIMILRRMAGDSFLPVRLATFLAVSKYCRDDFLSHIRSAATHLNPAEQETCATALGNLNDSHSTEILETLAESKNEEVKLAACRSLNILGNHDYRKSIIKLAKKEDLFAITMLASIPQTESVLKSLLKHHNIQIRFNAAISLLRHHDPAAIPTLLEILLSDENDLGFFPHYSLGRSLMTWKVIYSAVANSKQTHRDIVSATLDLKERLLQECMEYPEVQFLNIARTLFNHQQHSLIPLLVHLLENLNTPDAIALLQKKSSKIGAPFIRTYCNLALYRLNAPGNHEAILMEWLTQKHNEELIKFRPMSSWSTHQELSTFQLTPEETSRLLIESYETIADRHNANSIQFLLNAIKDGNLKNRYAIAGLLLKAIQ